MAHERKSREGKKLIASTVYLEKPVDDHYKKASKKKYGKENKSRLIVETLTSAAK